MFDSPYIMIVVLVLMMVFFYFMIIRPQKKQQKEAQDRINSLKVGDKVVTIGGFYGTINRVLDDGFLIEVANGVVVKIAKQGIAYPQNPPAATSEPAAEETETAKDDDKNNQSPIEDKK